MKTWTSVSVPTACASERKGCLECKADNWKIQSNSYLGCRNQYKGNSGMNSGFLCKYTIQNASNYNSHHSTQHISKLKAWQSPGDNSHPSCCLLPSVSKAATNPLPHSSAYHLHRHQFWDAACVKYPESPHTFFPFNSTVQSRSLSPSSTTTGFAHRWKGALLVLWAPCHSKLLVGM